MSYNYTYRLPFEQGFDPVPSTIWMQQNWHHSISLSVLYAIGIYSGQKAMLNRPGFDLRPFLIVWNTFLAVFSILGMVRFAPEFFYVLREYGFEYSVCVSSYAQGVTGFWTQMFAASKAFELVDTAFIILRKRKLIFLHWYHHITVLIYTWHAYKDHTAAGRWFVFMNYTVHAVMYSYYALQSLGYRRVPRSISMCVTSMQIAQMVAGVGIVWMAFKAKREGRYCQQTEENLRFSLMIYGSYFVLFARFFYNVYIARENKKEKEVNGNVVNKVDNVKKYDGQGVRTRAKAKKSPAA